MMFRKVKVYYNIDSNNRNIYNLLFYVRPAMRKAGKEKQYYEMLDKIHESKTYDKSLKVMRKYVKFVDPKNNKGGTKCQIG